MGLNGFPLTVNKSLVLSINVNLRNILNVEVTQWSVSVFTCIFNKIDHMVCRVPYITWVKSWQSLVKFRSVKKEERERFV